MSKLIIIASFPNDKPGGVGTYITGRAIFLSKDENVTILGRGTTFKSKKIKYLSLGIISKNPFYFFKNWFNLLKIYYSSTWDEIEIHNIPMALPLIFMGVKYNYFFHGPADEESKVEGNGPIKVFIAKILDHITLTRAFKVSVVSNYFKNYLINRFSNKIESPEIVEPKFHLKTEGFLNDNSNFNKLDYDYINVVCVRRLVKRTGVLEFFKEYLKYNNLHNNNYRFHICGDGPELNKIKNLVKGYEDKVLVYGRVSENFKNYLYNNCNFNLVPTIALEGFGLVLVEAALNGCPSVATNVGAMPEIIKSHKYFGSIYEGCFNSFIKSAKNFNSFNQKNRLSLKNFVIKKYTV